MKDTAQHQRLTEALSEYWDEKRSGRLMADEADIDPADLGGLWDYCFLLRVDAPHDYHYLYMGPSLIEAYGDDMTGHEVCERLMGEVAHPMLQKFKKVETSKQKMLDEDQFVNQCKMEVRYRAILLPLTGGGDDVAYILGGMKWKAY